MDISFRLEDRRFNYRVSAMLLSGTRILAMHDAGHCADPGNGRRVCNALPSVNFSLSTELHRNSVGFTVEFFTDMVYWVRKMNRRRRK